MQEIEKIRREILRLESVNIIIVLVIFGAWAYMLSQGILPIYSQTIEEIVATIGSIIVSILITVLISAATVGPLIREKKKEYRKAYKEYFVSGALKIVFTNIEYDHEKGLHKSIPDSTGVIMLGREYQSNDLITAKYKDREFMQADVHIYDETSNVTHTYFKGRWMLFRFPKQFKHKLIVIDKKYKKLIQPFIYVQQKDKYKRIETESDEFNKVFDIYAEDDFEAFYLLDPSFIDQTESLRKSHKGKVLLVFDKDLMHVAIDDRNDAFEPPSPLKKIKEQEEMQHVVEEIKLITNYIDSLKLKSSLFKK
ncbi:DUF3137 domain-containing protein [Candidatus Saccharibacteria bacterium]|nr:DUF3137 domain-containing protein [Candidatus Saccharibacteria bacterium]